jgi:hypothetical protein
MVFPVSPQASNPTSTVPKHQLTFLSIHTKFFSPPLPPTRPPRLSLYFFPLLHGPQDSFHLFTFTRPSKGLFLHHLLSEPHGLRTTSTPFHVITRNHFPSNMVTRTSFVTFPHHMLIKDFPTCFSPFGYWPTTLIHQSSSSSPPSLAQQPCVGLGLLQKLPHFMLSSSSSSLLKA